MSTPVVAEDVIDTAAYELDTLVVKLAGAVAVLLRDSHIERNRARAYQAVRALESLRLARAELVEKVW